MLAGCGAAEKLSPPMAVREAAESTANQKEGTFRLSLVGSDSDLNALFNDGAPLTDEDRKGLETFRDGHIAFSTGDDKFGLDVKVGELDHAVELRVVDKKLYGRADVAGLAKLFSASPDDVQRAVGQLAAKDGFEFLSAASAGRWIVADFTTLSGLFEDLGKQLAGGGRAVDPHPDRRPQAAMGQYKALKDAIGKALSEDVDIKKLGSDDVGDHYLGTVSSLRTFYAKVRPTLPSRWANCPFAQSLPPDSDVPDKPASLDVWIKSGRVSRLEARPGPVLTRPAPRPGPGGAPARHRPGRGLASPPRPTPCRSTSPGSSGPLRPVRRNPRGRRRRAVRATTDPAVPRGGRPHRRPGRNLRPCPPRRACPGRSRRRCGTSGR